MTSSTAFLRSRRADVHSKAPWAQFRYVATKLEKVVGELVAPLPPGAQILDYGCATSPYGHLFAGHAEFVRADLRGNPDADVTLLPDGTVPVGSESFDLILSTQVLEHVGRPELYLSECHRLLRPGGSLVLSTHGMMYYHPDPVDYWRWTSEGLTRIVSDAGLEVQDLRGIMGLASTAIQFLQDAGLARVPKLLGRPYLLVMQQLVAWADRAHSDASRVSNSLVYVVKANRPSPQR